MRKPLPQKPAGYCCPHCYSSLPADPKERRAFLVSTIDPENGPRAAFAAGLCDCCADEVEHRIAIGHGNALDGYALSILIELASGKLNRFAGWVAADFRAEEMLEEMVFPPRLISIVTAARMAEAGRAATQAAAMGVLQ